MKFNEGNTATMFSQVIRNQQLVSEYPVVVSCDVHDENTYIFATDTRTGEIKMDRYVIGGVRQVSRTVAKIGTKEEMIVLYEAGCLGYSLYRQLAKAGYVCKVIAPCSIPKSNGQKTDRQDAMNNFSYYAAGLLRFVSIPDEANEHSRECLRYRYQMVWERTAEKQKVQALLKRHAAVFTETKSYWTKKHYVWLKTVALPLEVRAVLDMRLLRIEQCTTSIDELDKRLMAAIQANYTFRRLYQAYHAITGIGPLGAITWVLEGQDLTRFAHPTKLMSYIGVIPRKKSSGGSDPALSITKAGNRYLRFVTVCAARCYTDRRLTQSKENLKKYPDALRGLLDRCQSRLCARYQHLRLCKKNGNKAKVAVARELCAYIWELAVKVLPTIDQEQWATAA